MSPVKPIGRIASLDGLRGLAALIVVFHHALLIYPGLSAAYLRDGSLTARWSIAWWLTWTPLHVIWVGHEAVIIFFVLSGLVLAMPFVDQPRPKWGGYYSKRLIRLYLPVIASVLVAAFLIGTGVRSIGQGGSGWLVELHPPQVSPQDLLNDMALLFGEPGAVNSVLWSLKWEVLFSLLLPLYLLLGRSFSKRPHLAFGGCLLLLAGGRVVDRSLDYLPLFLIGATIAFIHPRLSDWARRSRVAQSPAIWLGALTMAVALLLARWLFEPVLSRGGARPEIIEGTIRAAVASGAALLIVTVMFSAGARRVFLASPLQWLGRRSFSVYLVHEPLIVASAFAFGRIPDPRWFLPSVLLGILVAGELFFRAVEQPSLRLAKHAGIQTDARVIGLTHRVASV